MAIDYDALDAVPTTFQELSQMQGCKDGAVWKELTIDARAGMLDKFLKQWYTRSGAVSGSDQKTYDIGRLHVATGGGANDTAVLAELWVDYSIHLFKPQPPPSGG